MLAPMMPSPMNPMRMSGLLPRHLGTRRDGLSMEPALLDSPTGAA
jgi:hypothetical protein